MAKLFRITTTILLIIGLASCDGFMMSAYPNPAADELTIESTSDGATTDERTTESKGIAMSIFSAKLFDGTGAIRKTGESVDEKLTFLIKDLPEGQYYLHVTTDVETVSTQVIVKRGD